MKENNSYDKFSVSNEHKTKDFEVGVQCSVGLDTSDVVNKILAISVDGNCTQIETLSGEANVNGTIFVKLVYLTETGLVGNAEYTAPFSTVLKDDKINVNSTLKTNIKETSGNVASLSGNVAKVDCALKLCAICVNNEEISYLKETGNDVCKKNEETEYEKFEGMCSSNWIENFDLEVKDHIKQILSSSHNVFVLDSMANDGFVVANLEIVSKLMYLTNEEIPQVKTVYEKNTIKQEIECSNSKKDCKIDLFVTVQKDAVKNVIQENDDNIKVSVELPLNACVYVYSVNKVDVICDLYSTSNLTNVTNTSFVNTVICEPIVFEKKVEGSVTLDENEPRIDKLLAVNYSKATVTNEYIENGTYTVSGITTSNLIYFNEDDNMVNSVDIELPFELKDTVYEGYNFQEIAEFCKKYGLKSFMAKIQAKWKKVILISIIFLSCAIYI